MEPLTKEELLKMCDAVMKEWYHSPMDTENKPSEELIVATALKSLLTEREGLKQIGHAWIHKDGAVWEFNADKDREETLGMEYVPVYVMISAAPKQEDK